MASPCNINNFDGTENGGGWLGPFKLHFLFRVISFNKLSFLIFVFGYNHKANMDRLMHSFFGSNKSHFFLQNSTRMQKHFLGPNRNKGWANPQHKVLKDKERNDVRLNTTNSFSSLTILKMRSLLFVIATSNIDLQQLPHIFTDRTVWVLPTKISWKRYHQGILFCIFSLLKTKHPYL